MRYGTLALNNGFDYREQIDNRGSGLTVLAYLAATYRHSPEEDWRDRLRNGEVFLNGRQVGPEAVLDRGQWLLWRRPPWVEPDVPLSWAVLYGDEELLAAAKPCGLPTIPGGGFLEHTLLRLVRKDYPDATPVHRLGRGTSGIVLFARTARTRSVLCEALRQNRITKIYRALAGGTPARDNFSIDAPIGPIPHPKLGTINAACPDGRCALSRVRVLEHRTGASLVEVRIETGRPHQIRIHLAAAGHPLKGDPLYTSGGGINESGTALPGDLGYLLHAERISLHHPITGAVVEIWCCPPPELRMRGEKNSGARNKV